jgi:hypothetical protein
MNTDDFEQRLQRQAMRLMPDSWRDEILSNCSRRPVLRSSTAAGGRKEAEVLDNPYDPSTSSPRRLPGRGAAKPTTWWRELLWPCPQAWAALAAVWLVITAIHIFTPGASDVVEARAPRVTAELLAAVNERRLLLAELMASSPTEPPKTVPPRRRSDRRVTVVAA